MCVIVLFALLYSENIGKLWIPSYETTENHKWKLHLTFLVQRICWESTFPKRHDEQVTGIPIGVGTLIHSPDETVLKWEFMRSRRVIIKKVNVYGAGWNSHSVNLLFSWSKIKFPRPACSQNEEAAKSHLSVLRGVSLRDPILSFF